MKKRGRKVTAYILLLGLTLSNAPLFSAQESASSVAQKEEQSRLQRIYNWLYSQYGMPKRDWDILKGWLIKKWRREEIEPALDKQAKSIFKKYIIPAVVIAALATGTGVWWWRKKGIEQRAQMEKEWLEKHPLIRAVKEKKTTLGSVGSFLGLFIREVVRPDEFHQKKIKELIAEGALEKRGALGTPLMEAITSQQYGQSLRFHRREVVKKLIEYGADVNVDGGAPLLRAVSFPYGGDIEVIELLLNNGAHIEARDELGNTPLMIAAIDGNEKLVKMLLNKGADREAKNESGETALDIAMTEKIRELIEEYPRRREAGAFLFERGVEPSYISEVPPGVQEHIASYILGRKYTQQEEEEYEEYKERKQKAEERKKAAQKEPPRGQEGKQEENED